MVKVAHPCSADPLLCRAMASPCVLRNATVFGSNGREPGCSRDAALTCARASRQPVNGCPGLEGPRRLAWSRVGGGPPLTKGLGARVVFPEGVKTKGLSPSRVTVFPSQRTETGCAPSGRRRTCVSMTAGKLKTEFKKFLTGCDPGNTFPRGPWEIDSKGWTAVLGVSAPGLWAAGLACSNPSPGSHSRSGPCIFHPAQIHTQTCGNNAPCATDGCLVPGIRMMDLGTVLFLKTSLLSSGQTVLPFESWIGLPKFLVLFPLFLSKTETKRTRTKRQARRQCVWL